MVSLRQRALSAAESPRFVLGIRQTGTTCGGAGVRSSLRDRLRAAPAADSVAAPATRTFPGEELPPCGGSGELREEVGQCRRSRGEELLVNSAGVRSPEGKGWCSQGSLRCSACPALSRGSRDALRYLLVERPPRAGREKSSVQTCGSRPGAGLVDPGPGCRPLGQHLGKGLT